MKTVGQTNIKTITKWAIPAGILAMSVASIIAAGTGTGGSKSANTTITPANSDTQFKVQPAPEASPEITINGMTIPDLGPGVNDITIPGGKAHIEVFGGHTHVTAHSSGQSGDASNKSTDHVDINIDSHTSKDGSASSSSVTNSTSIFSTGSSNVNVSR